MKKNLKKALKLINSELKFFMQSNNLTGKNVPEEYEGYSYEQILTIANIYEVSKQRGYKQSTIDAIISLYIKATCLDVQMIEDPNNDELRIEYYITLNILSKCGIDIHVDVIDTVNNNALKDTNPSTEEEIYTLIKKIL